MFLTQITQGEMKELILCENCAKSRGLFDPQSLSFAEKFFPEALKERVESLVREINADKKEIELQLQKAAQFTLDARLSCPICGFTLELMRQTGRLGCTDCYSVFARELDANQEATPSDNTPTPALHEESTSSTELLIKNLEQKLQSAVQKEDYERAAHIRDEIARLRTQS